MFPYRFHLRRGAYRPSEEQRGNHPGLDFVGEGVRLGASFDTPPAAIGSVFRHVDHFHFCGAGFNTLFELQFLRKRPRAVFRGKGS